MLAVAVALLVGGALVVVILDVTLTRELRNTAMLRAQDAAALLAASPRAEPVTVDDVEEQVIQVVDGTGRVVAASANVRGLPRAGRQDQDPVRG
jgi:hypothetical protein